MDDRTLSLIEDYLDGNFDRLGLGDGELPLAGREKIGAIIEAFCSEMESMGYYAMLYCSSYYLNNRIPWQTISKYTVWVANYNVEYPSYYGDYGIWQYGIGTSAGIEGDVDVNYCYKDYEKIIKGCHRNGF